MISEKLFLGLREELDNSQNPLFLYDDDADGLCSFLLLYRYKGEGHGSVVKTRPLIDEKFLSKVDEYNPDKVFILDIAQVKQEFIDRCRVPIIWIDHHDIADDINKVKYFNPKKYGETETMPTSEICYNIVKQDVLIAAIGTISDWSIPRFLEDLRIEYPQFITESDKPEDHLFSGDMGKLIKIISFNLKGQIKDIRKSINALTRIKSPDEILNPQSEATRAIYKKYEKVNAVYERVLSDAMKYGKDNFLIYIYPTDELSLTKELSNELLFRNPDKIIVLGREKNGEVKMSLRSSKHNIKEALARSLVGIQGYGGGHEHACGANVKKEDFDKFLENLKSSIESS